MKTVFSSAELMEVAIMCLQQLPDTDPKKQEFYCHTDRKLVTKDEAELVCFGAGHDIETGEDEKGVS